MRSPNYCEVLNLIAIDLSVNWQQVFDIAVHDPKILELGLDKVADTL
jgi:hypothetical protein